MFPFLICGIFIDMHKINSLLSFWISWRVYDAHLTGSKGSDIRHNLVKSFHSAFYSTFSCRRDFSEMNTILTGRKGQADKFHFFFPYGKKLLISSTYDVFILVLAA